MVKKFYVTTPIYYVNAEPTVGSAYTTIIADVLARWYRLKNNEYKVFFLTGLDENSAKTVKAAKKEGYNDIKKYTDDMAKKWKNVWKILNISYDGFIRTTEPRHKKITQEFFLKLKEKGDIYKAKYEGLYCDDCEAYLNENELVDGKCLLHKKEPKKISEQNYFFKLSKYQDRILKHIEKNREFLLPESRRKEIINFIKGGLKDISISRENAEWGIDVPGEKNMKYWTWFDAVLNYISGAEGNWPADLHLIGKDIVKFHAVYFVGFLLSRWDEEKLPKKIFAHGFFTVNGQKMSKSLGNAVDPVYISKKFGVDSLRYYLIREIKFGEDGDFSEKALKNRINNELANDLGNLLNRAVTLISRSDVKLKGKDELSKELNFGKIDSLMEELKLTEALAEIWKFVNICNKYVNDKEPWRLKGKELENVLYNMYESLRIISILISPFMPETSEKICEQLGIKLGNFNDLKFREVKGKVKKGKVLFEKI